MAGHKGGRGLRQESETTTNAVVRIGRTAVETGVCDGKQSEAPAKDVVRRLCSSRPQKNYTSGKQALGIRFERHKQQQQPRHRQHGM